MICDRVLTQCVYVAKLCGCLQVAMADQTSGCVVSMCARTVNTPPRLWPPTRRPRAFQMVYPFWAMSSAGRMWEQHGQGGGQQAYMAVGERTDGCAAQLRLSQGHVVAVHVCDDMPAKGAAACHLPNGRREEEDNGVRLRESVLAQHFLTRASNRLVCFTRCAWVLLMCLPRVCLGAKRYTDRDDAWRQQPGCAMHG